MRPEFGPTLPALLARRGVSRRAMAIGAALLVALAVAAWVAAGALRDAQRLVVDGPPEFNLVYPSSVLHPVAPRAGELARLEGHRPRVSASIVVRGARLPAYEGADAIGGYLPIVAERRLAELRARYGPIAVYDEGKARISGLPGYQIGFGAEQGGSRLFGRDAYVFPEGADAAQGALLSLRRVVRGRQRPADGEWFDRVKEAFASFNFGSGRP